MERDASLKNRGNTRARARTKTAPTAEPREAALRTLAKQEGNDGVKHALSASECRRDGLLAYVSGRLGAVRNAQQAETRAQAHSRDWVDQVARGTKGMTPPDPSRWAAPAQAYRHAVEALAQGDLARGAHLLERAHDLETRTFEALPAQVEVPEAERTVAPLPAEARATHGGEGCPRRAATEILAQADAIVRVSDDADAVSGRRIRSHRGWWDREPDEDAVGKDEKKSERAASPSSATTETAAAHDTAAGRGPDAERTPETAAPEKIAPIQEHAPERDAPSNDAAGAGKGAAARVRNVARKKR